MTAPVVFDRARLRRMQVLFAVATVPALGVLVVFVVYLVASLVLGGGRMGRDSDTIYDAAVSWPVFPVPAGAVIAAGAVVLVATVAVVPRIGVNQLGGLTTALAWDGGSAIASMALGWIFSDAAPGDGPGPMGDHWIAAVCFASATLVVLVRLLLLAPKETPLRRAHAIFFLGFGTSPQPVPDGFALDAPVGWRSEADPIRLVPDVDDGPAALSVVVGPIGPDVAMPDGTLAVNGSPVVRVPAAGSDPADAGARIIRYHVFRPRRTDGLTLMTTIAPHIAAQRIKLRAVIETSDRIVETFEWR